MMEFKYILICIFVIFLSLNVIAATDTSNLENITLIDDVNSDVTAIDDSSNEVILNHGDCDNLNENENTEVLNENGMNDIYVSPNGEGNGSEGNSTSLNNAISNIQDNSVVHMADGNYTFDSVLTIALKNNITIIADTPGNAVISGGSSSLANLFSLKGVNNFKLSGIIFKDITFKTTLITSGTQVDNKVTYDSQNLFFEDCSFINCSSTSNSGGLLFAITACDNFSINNCYFANNMGSNSYALLNLVIHPVLNRSTQPVTPTRKSYCSIQNCTFENNTCKDYMIRFMKGSIPALLNSEISVSECNFINNSFSKADIYVNNNQFTAAKKNSFLVYSDPGITNIVDCNFSSNDNLPAILVDAISSEGLIFEDNFVKSEYGIQFSDSSLKAKGSITSQDYTTSTNGFFLGKLHSIVTITVSNADVINVTAGDKIIITSTIVDNMGNAIRIPNLRLVINGSEYDAIFNNGVYETEYTVPNTSGLLSIDVNYTTVESVSKGYSYIDKQQHDTFSFNLLDNRMCEVYGASLFVKPALNMTMDNVSDSVYGDNVTVKVNISSLESGNLVYQFIKDNVVVKTVTDSFNNNVSTVSVNDLSAGDYTVSVKYAEDDNFGATTITKTFTVNKANSTVEILIDPTIPVGDNIVVQAIVPANAGGNVTFRLNTDNKTVNITDKAIFDGLFNGTYVIYAVYNGDDNYNPSEEYNVTFEVVKVNSTLDVEHTSIVPGENVDIIITLNKDINDNITITINNGEPISRKLTNGTLTYTIENIALGDYNVTVSFAGNEKYFENVASTLFTVERLESNLNVSAANVDWGNPVVVSVSTDERFSGDVEVSIGDRTEIAHVVNGSGEATFTNLAAETYTVTAKLNETDVFNADEKNVASELSLSNDIVFDYGSSNATTATFAGAVNITAVVVEDSNANVVVEGNVITVSGLNAGNYTLKVTTNPDENHTEVSATVNITVNKVNSFIDIRNEISYDYGGIGQCDVYTEGAVNFTARIVNHTEAIISISPISIVNVSGLGAGKYVLEVSTNPDKNHLSVTSSVNVTVSKVDSQITIPNIVFDYGATGNATVTVVGATGINASVLNHTEAVVNIVNNTITVSGLAAGSYVLQATTIPDGNHNPVTATANITVNGVEVPADKAISTNVPANTKSPTFSIKLDKDATGTFTVNIDNGKIVKTVELKDGAASITVADLAAGDHTISVSYSGDGKYAPITQNTTLNIKEPVKPTPKVTKKATKITAKKATFKAKKKTKKYTITLKSGKKAISKVKVTIKVGKKTYTAKTNKKGKATFNLKKLTKKGKYTAVIKFKGNKNYKATSKKVKITVKK